jgi:hypothetical protein
MIDQSATIDRLAAAQLGGAAGPQMPPAAGPQMPQPPQPPAPERATAQETATEQAAPKDESRKIAEDAIVYEVEFGPDDKRKLTPAQIKSTMERYAALNHEHANMKPVMEVAKALMQRYGANSQQFAEALANLVKAQESNPTMGNTQGRQPDKAGVQQPNTPEADPLAKWEEENAASLPPGYRDLMSTQRQMQQMLMQTQQMMQSMMARGQGVADAARVATQDVQSQRTQAIRQTIANNLDRAQQALQLPDTAAQDFMTFAAERGFTLEDFIDPQMTQKVMSDFRSVMQTPEMERLRGIAERRQAYTGMLGSAPSAPAQTPDPSQAPFDRMVQGAMARRGIG